MTSPKKHLKHLCKLSRPDRRFERALWCELTSAFAQEYPALRSSRRRLFAVPALIAIVLCTMGVGSYAYASPSVNEDHILYPLKTSIERVEATLPRSAAGEAQFHARMMERRIAEGEVMLRASGVSVEHLEGIAQEFDSTLDAFDREVDVAFPRQPLVEQLRSQTSRYQYLIEAHSKDADLFSLQSLRDRIENSDLHADEKALLLEQLTATSETTSDSVQGARPRAPLNGKMFPQDRREDAEGI